MYFWWMWVVKLLLVIIKFGGGLEYGRLSISGMCLYSRLIDFKCLKFVVNFFLCFIDVKKDMLIK